MSEGKGFKFVARTITCRNNNNHNVRTIIGAPLCDKVSSQGRFTILDIVGADISFIY